VYYVSLDLETTCLTPNPNHILMFSFVLEDTDRPEVPVEELPHFTGFVDQPTITGSAFALSMNSWILDRLSGRSMEPSKYEIYNAENFEKGAVRFLHEAFRGRRGTVAGKNVAGFDLQFLPYTVKGCFKHRVMDIGMACMDLAWDQQVPDLLECKKRCGIDTPVAHDAREDALDVIRCFRVLRARAL